MSDIFEVVLVDDSLELVFEGGYELLFIDEGVEVIVDEQLEVLVQDTVLELMTESEPGIPSGGAPGQVLAKKSSSHFDVEWITLSPKITVGSEPPVAPSVGDLWVHSY